MQVLGRLRFLLLFAALTALGARADMKVQLLPDPDTASGLFPGFLFQPVINNNGTIAAGSNGGIYASTGQPFQNVIPTGSVLPGSGGATLSKPLSLNLDDAGRFGFSATTPNGGTAKGYWVGGSPASLQKVMQGGDPAPGMPGFTLQGVGEVYQAGTTVFSTGATDGTTTRTTILRGSSSADLAPLATTTDQAPGLAPGMTYQLFDRPKVNASGQALIVAPNNGVWRGSTSASLTPVAVTGQRAPGLEPIAKFGGFSLATLNNKGSVAFVDGPSSSAISQAIFTDRSGSLALAYASGMQAPGAPAGVKCLQYTELYLSNGDQIGFKAFLGGTGVVGNNDNGLFIESPTGGLHMVAREGDAAPGATGETFNSFTSALINAKGQMVFKGYTSGLQTGLWAYDPEAGLQLITLQNIPLPTNDGQTFRFLTISYAGSTQLGAGGGDGSPRALNDLGQFVFEADRGGTGGNFVTSGVYAINVPEPRALPLLTLLLILQRRRRKFGA
jgi:hypothetical protein